ncbi:unnamed protein product [Prunus brigantina]
MSWTPFAYWVPNWSGLLTVLGVGLPVGMGLQFLLDLGCPTYVNVGLLFTLLHIANLTSLLSNLREILENLYCLSKRGVAMHPKFAQNGPAIAYCRKSGLDHAGPHALQTTSTERILMICLQNIRSVLPKPPSKGKVDVKSSRN